MDCPRCDRELRDGSTSCPCGWRSRKQISAPKTDPWCAWTTNGRRCYMAGDLAQDIGDGRKNYCHWHYVCLHHPEFVEDFEEFSAWNQKWKRYCCIENHHPESEIFDSILGIKPIRSKPRWCGLIMCKHFSIVDTWQWVQEGNGVPVGTVWAELSKQQPPRRRYSEVNGEEQQLWTAKTVIARQKLGLVIPSGIAEKSQDSEVPF